MMYSVTIEASLGVTCRHKMYNKLFTKILDSSIWLAPDSVRLVWITMIAAMDEEGNCMFACAANLAARARVTVEEAKKAIAEFEAPDENSADPDNEGRRIERIPGGWHLLNAHKYRAMVTRAIAKEKTRLRTEEYRARKKAVTLGDVSVTPSDTDTNTNINRTKEKENIGLRPHAAAEAAVDAVPPCPDSKLLDLFTAKVIDLPRPRKELWGGASQKAMKARWAWVLTACRPSGERYASTQAEGLDWFGRFFDQVAESNFLTGRDGRWSNCDLGWLMNQTNFAKVVQGNYVNRESL